MKLSDGFDARRLRPRNASTRRLRLGAGLAALLATLGVLLSMAGMATLLGRPAGLSRLNESPTTAGVFVIVGLVLLSTGVLLWRRCRRRSRLSSDLSMAPHLMKKRD